MHLREPSYHDVNRRRVTSPRRVVRLIKESIDRLELNLDGLVVLTEAATGHFATTAAVACAAGARTIAIAADSTWGTAQDAAEATIEMARACSAHENLEIASKVSREIMETVDLITNLGSVRPIGSEQVAHMKATAVVALMCEPWEVRETDVDLAACARRAIVALGTNENSPDWPVFSYSGPLAGSMLLSAGFEILGSRVAILGRDKFAPEIAKWLRKAGALVRVDQVLSLSSMRRVVRNADAVVVADYGDEMIVGANGLLATSDLLEFAPDATIIQFAGGMDESDLRNNGFQVWPPSVVSPRRMSRTFSALGPKPVVQLHAAGLRVGQAAARLRLQGVDTTAVISAVCRELAIAQAVPSDRYALEGI